MIKPSYVLLQVLLPTLSNFGQVDASLFLLLTIDKMSTQRFCQLKEGGNASIRETIEPFFSDGLQSYWDVSTACRIMHVFYVHLCLIDIQMIVLIRGSVE